MYNEIVSWMVSWSLFKADASRGTAGTRIFIDIEPMAVIVISKPSSRHGVLPSSRKAGCCWGVV